MNISQEIYPDLNLQPMKIAITSAENNMESTVSKFFARAGFFAIYDSDDKSANFIENPFCRNPEHVGEKVVKFLGDLGIKRIISLNFGSKAKKIADEYKIQLIVIGDSRLLIKSIIDMLRKHD